MEGCAVEEGVWRRIKPSKGHMTIYQHTHTHTQCKMDLPYKRNNNVPTMNQRITNKKLTVRNGYFFEVVGQQGSTDPGQHRLLPLPVLVL